MDKKDSKGNKVLPTSSITQGISKDEALGVCNSCTKQLQKGCIITDIEGAGEYLYNPPECLISQTKSLPKIPTSAKPNGRQMMRSLPNKKKNGRQRRNGKRQEIVISGSKQEKPKIPQSAESNGRQMVDKTENSTHKKPTSPESNGRKVYQNVAEKSTKKQKNGRISGVIIEGKPPNTTQAEQKFLRLLKDGIISPNKLAVCTKSSLKNVYKYLGKLRKKGIIDKNNLIVSWGEGGSVKIPTSAKPNGRQTVDKRGGGIYKANRQAQPLHGRQTVEKRGGTCLPQAQADGKTIRIHGQQFRIGILSIKNPAQFKTKIGVQKFIDGNEIRVWGTVIEIYAKKSLSFISDNGDIMLAISEGTEKSLDYWIRIIGQIQNDLGIELVRERTENIRIVKQHIAHVGNEFAKDRVMRGEKFHIYTDEGKLRMIVDASFKLPELETLNVGSEVQDMERSVKQVKDWIDHDPPTGSEFERAMKSLVEGMREELKTIIQEQGKEQMKVLAASQLTPETKSTILRQILENETGQPKNSTVENKKPTAHDHPYYG